MSARPVQKKALSSDHSPHQRKWIGRIVWPTSGALAGCLIFMALASNESSSTGSPEKSAQNIAITPTDQSIDGTSNTDPAVPARASENHPITSTTLPVPGSDQITFHQNQASTSYTLGLLPEVRDHLLNAADEAEQEAFRRATDENLLAAERERRAGKAYFLFLLNESRRFAMRNDVLFAGMLLDSALARFPDCFGELARVKMFEASLHEQNQAPLPALLVLTQLTKEIPPQDPRYHLIWGRIAEIYLATHQVQDAKDAYFRLAEKAISLEQESYAYLNLAHIAATVNDVPLLSRCKNWMDEKAPDSDHQHEVANLLKNTRAKMFGDISREILFP